MREIKFRAWDNKAKEWLLGYDQGHLGGFSLFGECILLGEWGHILNEFILQQRDRTPEDLIVMQYTGLKDRNGKEIYEGDVVHVEMCECTGHDENGNEEWINCIGEVSHEDGMFVFDGHSAGTIPVNAYIEKMIVIGNIYENPELTTVSQAQIQPPKTEVQEP